MTQVEAIILVVTGTAMLAVAGVGWWIWRSPGPAPRPLPPAAEGAPVGEPFAGEPTLHSRTEVGLASSTASNETMFYRSPEPSETVVYAPPEPSKTVLYARPESPQSVVYTSPEPSETVVYARPDPTVTVRFAAPESGSASFAGELSTEVFSLDQMPFARRPTKQDDPIDEDEDEGEQPTQIISLAQFDDSPTRIISLHEMFVDKTQSIPHAEILAVARAAQAAAREAVRATKVERPSPPSSSSEPARPRARQSRDFETAAGRLPPRGWSTAVTEPAPKPETKAAETKPAETKAPGPEARSSPEPPPAKPPELAEAVLIEHFEGAVEALQHTLPSEGEHDLEALAAGPQARWRTNLDVLKLNTELAARLVLLPTLFDAEQSEGRRLTAALALLNMLGGSGLLDAIEDFDLICHRVVTTALAHLEDGVLAESIATMGTALTRGERRLEWLSVFASRAADPGPELIRELLASAEPGALAMGLRLLPLHAKASSLAPQIDRHLLSTKPSIRNAALIAGLALGRPSAWMQCKQAARAPDSAEPCLLLATLGTDRDRTRLVSWAKRAAVPDYAGWALGVSGRPSGIVASLELAEAGDDAAHDQAIAGFRVATGADVDTASGAKAWWNEHGERFEAGRRYLRGELLNSASLAAELVRGSQRWREAIALELLVRSQGQVRLPLVFMPSRASALAAKLDELELDLEADYSPAPSKASR